MATAEELRSMSKEDVLAFIRKRLSFDKSLIEQFRYINRDNTEEFRKNFEREHYRFDMSGYENKTGDNTLHNQFVLNKFADLGIYDHTSYLFLDFYKGHPTLYYKYFNGLKNEEVDLAGFGTTEIIYEIFKITIFTGGGRRRRI